MANRLTVLVALAATFLAGPIAAQTVQSVAGLNPSGRVVSVTGATVTAGDLAFDAINESVVIDAAGAGGLSMSISGTWSGTMRVQWSDKAAGPWQDGDALAAGASAATTITANQQYLAAPYGRYARVFTSAWSSGIAVVTPTLWSQRPAPPGGGGGGNNTIGDVGTASFSAACTTLTLPGVGGTYASGDLVANNATAGSVVSLTCTVGRYSGGPITITRARLNTSTTGLTNAAFRTHVYTAAPTVTNGNDGVFLSPISGHFCRLDVTVDQAFSDGATGIGLPVNGTSCTARLSGTTDVRVLVEARAAYAWTAAQTLIVTLEGFN